MSILKNRTSLIFIIPLICLLVISCTDLIFDNPYETGGTNPQITLIDEDTIKIEKQKRFNDPGFNVTDNDSADLKNLVKTFILDSINDTVESNTFTQNEGWYRKFYTVTNANDCTDTEIRYIRVNPIFDDVPPKITLIGNSTIEIDSGKIYIDPGATAEDNVDGGITNKIQTENNVNTDSVGKYDVIYRVADAAGNKDSAKREVYVQRIKDTIPPIITMEGDTIIYINYKTGRYIDSNKITAIDNLHWDISGNIEKHIPTIDPNRLGAKYTIMYTVSDNHGNSDTAYRLVIIKDLEPPNIRLKGLPIVNLNVYAQYIEDSAYAIDNVDGKIPFSEFQYDLGGLDTAVAGQYIVKYTISDSTGNTATKDRIVNIIEPDSILFEDFEKSPNNQTTYAIDSSFGSNEGFWFGLNDNGVGGQSTMEPDPFTNTNFSEIVTDNVGFNNSKGLFIQFNLKDSTLEKIPHPAPFAAIGFNLKSANSYYDFKNFYKIKFHAKGPITLRVAFITKKVNEWTPLEDGWGHMGKTITVSGSWDEYEIIAKQLEPLANSPQSAAGLKWSDDEVNNKVQAVVFYPIGVSGTTAKLYLDNIIMNGVDIKR